MVDPRAPRHVDRGTSILLAAVFAVAGIAVGSSCLARHDDEDVGNVSARCATCHGNPNRDGDYLQRAAPPRDLSAATDPGYPGVGAHAIHLYAGTTHAAIPCGECHVVPEAVDSPGHADDGLPAEISFGALATAGERTPRYDAVARSCTDTWCHRGANAVWTQPRSSKDACGSCHGLPPLPPHPQSERCDVCHGQVVDAAGHIGRPELHVNGTIERTDAPCATCHGTGDDPAPPVDTLGHTATSAIGVGAHQAHLEGGAFSRPLACSECHVVPSAVDSPGHADELPAEVIFTGVVATQGHAPAWDRTIGRCADTWCHGPTPGSTAPSARWVDGVSLGCAGCHGLPPPSPHPQMTDCSRCHGEVVASDDKTITERERHVDGVVDVNFDETCTSCHGSTSPAPPPDVSGSSDPASPGVGAHATHVFGTARSRAVPCAECHVVPDSVLDVGHVDTSLPAELAFSGAAVAFGAAPNYDAGSCSSTSCHGAVFPLGHASGGTNSVPSWTVVDGTQAACGSCHSLPPPAPHPKVEFSPICSACHSDIAPDNVTFTQPDLHVDGEVTFGP